MIRGDKGGLGQKRHGAVSSGPSQPSAESRGRVCRRRRDARVAPSAIGTSLGGSETTCLLGFLGGCTFRPCSHDRKGRLAQDSEKGDSEW